jgi:hypothetical protein
MPVGSRSLISHSRGLETPLFPQEKLAMDSGQNRIFMANPQHHHDTLNSLFFKDLIDIVNFPENYQQSFDYGE